MILFEIDQYDAIARELERAEAQCDASLLTEESAIEMWLACLDKVGLTPQEVWAG